MMIRSVRLPRPCYFPSYPPSRPSKMPWVRKETHKAQRAQAAKLYLLLRVQHPMPHNRRQLLRHLRRRLRPLPPETVCRRLPPLLRHPQTASWRTYPHHRRPPLASRRRPLPPRARASPLPPLPHRRLLLLLPRVRHCLRPRRRSRRRASRPRPLPRQMGCPLLPRQTLFPLPRPAKAPPRLHLPRLPTIHVQIS
eukprot:Rmarinus@m.8878